MHRTVGKDKSRIMGIGFVRRALVGLVCKAGEVGEANYGGEVGEDLEAGESWVRPW